MAEVPLLRLDPDRIETEARRAREKEIAELAVERAQRRLVWQCVALSFSGVPFYALSWHRTDPRETGLLVAAGFFVSYALPYFRWLAYHVGTSEEFNR